jgi:hypothetical protein
MIWTIRFTSSINGNLHYGALHINKKSNGEIAVSLRIWNMKIKIGLLLFNRIYLIVLLVVLFDYSKSIIFSEIK